VYYCSACLLLSCVMLNLNLYYLQNDIDLIHAIEAETKKQLDAYECNEEEVLEDITKVAHLHCY